MALASSSGANALLSAIDHRANTGPGRQVACDTAVRVGIRQAQPQATRRQGVAVARRSLSIRRVKARTTSGSKRPPAWARK
ncbi:MAG: hypothetical protein OHK0015_50320 [Chloroflexi bacterium OHK40]